MNNTSTLSLVLISVGIFFLFTKPLVADIYLKISEREKYQETLEKVKLIKDIQLSLGDKLNKLSDEEREKVAILLPENPNATKFVAEVDSVASKHGISIDSISYEIINNDASKSVSEASPITDYNSMIVAFTFNSDYQHMKDFISDLEKSLRIIDIRNIESGEAEDEIYNYKIRTEIYWLK